LNYQTGGVTSKSLFVNRRDAKDRPMAKKPTTKKTAIKKQGGWKHDSTVRTYIEEGQLFDKNAADQLLKSLNKPTQRQYDAGQKNTDLISS